MRKHVIKKLQVLAGLDDRIMLMCADLGFHVVEEFSQCFPGRFVNCGIAETNMLSAAAGLALEGNIVFVYSIGNFPTLRCMEQIRNDICYHQANVKILSVGGGFSYGTLGMTHHATEDIAAMRSLPGMRVYAPADPTEAERVLEEAYHSNMPCYIRLARGQDQQLHVKGRSVDVSRLVPFSDYRSTNYDISLLAAGPVLAEGIAAEQILIGNGLQTRLYSVPSIKPLDMAGIQSVANSSRLLATIEEHNVIGGLGSAVAEVLSGMAVHAPLLRFGLQDEFSKEVGSTMHLRRFYRMDGENVSKAAALKYKELEDENSSNRGDKLYWEGPAAEIGTGRA